MNLFAPQPAAAQDGPFTVAQVVDLFLCHLGSSYAPRALEERVRTLDRFTAALGSRLVADCRPVDLLLWIRKNPRWQSASTVRAHVQLIQRVFNWAAGDMRMFPENPFRGVHVDEGELRRPMTEIEFRSLLRLSGANFRRFLTFLKFTGCRPGEASAIDWDCVDLALGVAVLQQHKTRRKTRKPRVIPLVRSIVRMLDWMREHDRNLFGDDPMGPVFRNAHGHRWQRTTLAKKIDRLRARARLSDDCVLYGLRHRFGTQAVLNGAKLPQLAKAMGHASMATTLRHYVHIDQEIEAIKEAAELAGGPGPKLAPSKGAKVSVQAPAPRDEGNRATGGLAG